MIKSYTTKGWKLVLDSSEIYPDDPGNGTPAMVYGPGNISGTYYAAIDMGECDSTPVPDAIYNWLESLEDKVNNFMNYHTPE